LAKGQHPQCAVCKKRRAAFPKTEPMYCADDWQRKFDLLMGAGLDFNFVRYFRAEHAEAYLVFHRRSTDPVGRLVVLARPGERLVVQLLEDSFEWEAPAYELPGDPKVDTWRQALIPTIFSHILDSWAGVNEEPSAEIWTFKGRLVDTEAVEVIQGERVLWG